MLTPSRKSVEHHQLMLIQVDSNDSSVSRTIPSDLFIILTTCSMLLVYFQRTFYMEVNCGHPELIAIDCILCFTAIMYTYNRYYMKSLPQSSKSSIFWLWSTWGDAGIGYYFWTSYRRWQLNHGTLWLWGAYHMTCDTFFFFLQDGGKYLVKPRTQRTDADVI